MRCPARAGTRAIKYLEKLEGAPYPYGRFAQQAQIDIAYSLLEKTASAPRRSPPPDRFIKLYPKSRQRRLRVLPAGP